MMNEETQDTSRVNSAGGTCEAGENPSLNMAEGCGPGMTEMMSKCPCGSMFKTHKLACGGMFLLIALMFLISQVGGILGILAFFRTL